MNTPTLTHSDHELIEWFESMGYTHDWDADFKNQQYWHEFLDPDSGGIAIQIGTGVTKEEFLNAWDLSDDEPAPFFVGGDGESEEWARLEKNIQRHRGHES